jgi:phytanoyl-CoA hydroxylase
MSLTPAQVEQYFDQGYLLLPGLIGASDLEQYDRRFVDLVEGKDELAPAMKIMRDVMVVKGAVEAASAVHAVNKLLCLEDDPALFAYARHSGLVAAVCSLLGDDVYSLSSNVFNKPPGVDGRHPMHQDLRYFRLGPADKIVGVWTAMLPATRETGCLAVIPGSHKEGQREHENPDWDFVNFGFYGINDVDLDQRVHVEMQPGDTLLFHPLIIHGSGRNRSTQFRRAISVHYAAGDCQSPKSDWHHNPQTRHISS